jgi:xanthine dehydrogenase accessory factor
MTGAVLDQILADRAAKRPAVLATHLRTGKQVLLHPSEDGSDDPLREAAREAARRDRSGTVEGPDGDVFLHVFNPPVRVVVVGAVHIAQALVPMARLAGYDVLVVDPRRAFASEERFAGSRCSSSGPKRPCRACDPTAAPRS